jgi:hypothetical protein
MFLSMLQKYLFIGNNEISKHYLLSKNMPNDFEEQKGITSI